MHILVYSVVVGGMGDIIFAALDASPSEAP